MDIKYLTEEEAKQHDGEAVTCYIVNKYIRNAKLHIEYGKVYICQNLKDGTETEEKCEYLFTWRWDESVSQVKLISKGESIMGEPVDILEELKLVGLDEKVRLLRKYGLVDGDGQPTDKGQKAIWPLLFALVSDRLVENIKTAEKLRKANKKSKKED